LKRSSSQSTSLPPPSPRRAAGRRGGCGATDGELFESQSARAANSEIVLKPRDRKSEMISQGKRAQHFSKRFSTFLQNVCNKK
jgi:hypothetical protein